MTPSAPAPTPSGSAPDAGIIVMAKEPVAGRVKTRLCPPFSPTAAASLAEAALADTLAVVADTPAAWRTVALEGQPGPWLPAGLGVVAQRGDGFDERLAAAFTDCGAPAVVIGADTPQITRELLVTAMATLGKPSVDAVIGRAPDGGYWILGLRRADPDVFLGVPMSTPTTAQAQCLRLDSLGLRVEELAPLRDVDTIDDAIAVAAQAPRSRFASTLANALDLMGRS